MDETTNTPAPAPAPTPEPIAEACKKHESLIIGLGILVVVLGLLSTFFGYSYKSVTKENESLKTQVKTLTEQKNSNTTTTETDTPVNLGGKIAYVRQKKTVNNTSTNLNMVDSSTQLDKSTEKTVVKKDFATFKVGTNIDRDVLFGVQRNVLDTPLGNFGIEADPNITDFKKSAAFITYQP